MNFSYHDDDGKMKSLSSKCLDINNEMARLMGVTEPLLNLVIFCHQEDSNWPLDESSKVKEKFDAIFAAQKYNDCLKEIKNQRLVNKHFFSYDQFDFDYLTIVRVFFCNIKRSDQTDLDKKSKPRPNGSQHEMAYHSGLHSLAKIRAHHAIFFEN